MTQATPTIPTRRTTLRVIATALGICLLVALAATAIDHAGDATSTITNSAEPPFAAVATAPDDVAGYARSHRLTGLSPASLAQQDAGQAAPARRFSSRRPRGRNAVVAGRATAVYEAYRDIARYAQANGLTGLSPASLGPAVRRAANR